ncbi:MAG TPA: hypothetical protein VIM51_01825 [Desulfosporosinus sp.]
MVDDYIFRRELDLRTNFPEMIVQLKTDRESRKMDLAKIIELYDNFYAMQKKHFLLDHISKEEKSGIENVAIEQVLERARQEWEKTMQ